VRRRRGHAGRPDRRAGVGSSRAGAAACCRGVCGARRTCSGRPAAGVRSAQVDGRAGGGGSGVSSDGTGEGWDATGRARVLPSRRVGPDRTAASSPPSPPCTCAWRRWGPTVLPRRFTRAPVRVPAGTVSTRSRRSPTRVAITTSSDARLSMSVTQRGRLRDRETPSRTPGVTVTGPFRHRIRRATTQRQSPLRGVTIIAFWSRSSEGPPGHGPTSAVERGGPPRPGTGPCARDLSTARSAHRPAPPFPPAAPGTSARRADRGGVPPTRSSRGCG
jgi:hypothetical protein